MKNLKAAIAIIISALLLLGICSCSGLSKAEKALDDTLSGIKNFDIEALEALSGGDDESILDIDALDGTAEGHSALEFAKVYFSKLTYSFNETDETDPDNVVITTSVSVPDMEALLTAALSKIAAYAESHPEELPDMSEEETASLAASMLTEALEESEKTADTTIDITVSKNSGGEYEVVFDEALGDALFGGASKILESID